MLLPVVFKKSQNGHWRIVCTSFVRLFISFVLSLRYKYARDSSQYVIISITLFNRILISKNSVFEK